jgi:hypothetical protein
MSADRNYQLIGSRTFNDYVGHRQEKADCMERAGRKLGTFANTAFGSRVQLHKDASATTQVGCVALRIISAVLAIILAPLTFIGIILTRLSSSQQKAHEEALRSFNQINKTAEESKQSAKANAIAVKTAPAAAPVQEPVATETPVTKTAEEKKDDATGETQQQQTQEQPAQEPAVENPAPFVTTPAQEPVTTETPAQNEPGEDKKGNVTAEPQQQPQEEPVLENPVPVATAPAKEPVTTETPVETKAQEDKNDDVSSETQEQPAQEPVIENPAPVAPTLPQEPVTTETPVKTKAEEGKKDDVSSEPQQQQTQQQPEETPVVAKQTSAVIEGKSFAEVAKEKQAASTKKTTVAQPKEAAKKVAPAPSKKPVAKIIASPKKTESIPVATKKETGVTIDGPQEDTTFLGVLKGETPKRTSATLAKRPPAPSGILDLKVISEALQSQKDEKSLSETPSREESLGFDHPPVVPYSINNATETPTDAETAKNLKLAAELVVKKTDSEKRINELKSELNGLLLCIFPYEGNKAKQSTVNKFDLKQYTQLTKLLAELQKNNINVFDKTAADPLMQAIQRDRISDKESKLCYYPYINLMMPYVSLEDYRGAVKKLDSKKTSEYILKLFPSTEAPKTPKSKKKK